MKKGWFAYRESIDCGDRGRLRDSLPAVNGVLTRVFSRDQP
jgi:hypothetical protein